MIYKIRKTTLDKNKINYNDIKLATINENLNINFELYNMKLHTGFLKLHKITKHHILYKISTNYLQLHYINTYPITTKLNLNNKSISISYCVYLTTKYPRIEAVM